MSGSIVFRASRGRFVGRFDEQHRQLPLAVELAQVGDREPIVFRQSHSQIPSPAMAGIARLGVRDKPPASFCLPLVNSDSSVI
jgi:hypothetical protein